MSRVLDQHRFDALSASLAPEPGAAVMMLDRDLRIRGVNAAYEELSLRQRDDLLGKCVFDEFPDDPSDPQASGSSQLAVSIESALSRNTTATMPIVRYDICDPKDPDVFLPKLWTCSNLAVSDGEAQIGVLHQVAPITSLDDALPALTNTVPGGPQLGTAEQLHVLSVFALKMREDRLANHALAQEIKQLHQAIETRDIIGQAKGMLMERFDIDSDGAFALLATLSQRSNTALVVVARKLVEIDHPSE